MRLIDADVLKSRIELDCGLFTASLELEDVMAQIDVMPTTEASETSCEYQLLRKQIGYVMERLTDKNLKDDAKYSAEHKRPLPVAERNKYLRRKKVFYNAYVLLMDMEQEVNQNDT